MSKPAFDPSQPFKPADKPPFDPNAPHQVADSGDQQGIMSKLGSGLQDVASMYAARKGSLIRGASLGNLDPADLPGIGKAYSQAYKESPVNAAVGQVEGGLGAGGAISAVAPVASSRLGRVAVNGAVGAVQGGLRKPEGDESRLGNAASGLAEGAGLASVLEAAAPTARALKLDKIAQWLGTKIKGVSPEVGENYALDPERAEKLYDMSVKNPRGLSEEVKGQLRGGLDETFDNVSRPALSRVEKALAGKNIEVAPGDFQGTAAGNEINRSVALQPRSKTWQIPVEEKYAVSASPVRPTAEISKPEIQNVYSDRSYEPIEVPVSSVSRSIERAGPEAIIEEGSIPRGVQTIEQLLGSPSRTGLTGSQALRAKRLSQKAAFENQTKGLNPLAYNAKDDAEAIAAGKLKSALENVSPSTVDDNKILEEASRYSAHARNSLKNNPAALLQDSDSLGSVPTRSMREYLDTHGGTDLEGMAKALAAGREVNRSSPNATWLKKGLMDPVGRSLLKTPSKLEAIDEYLQNTPNRMSLFPSMFQYDEK